jgi:uncharacterized protein YjgD (DUF1641 family)
VAKAIQQIERTPVVPEEKASQDKEALIAALLERREAIEKAILFLQRADERGLLDVITALIGQGDKVMGVVSRELNKPHNSTMLVHFVKLAEMVGELDVEKLQPLIAKVNQGIEKADELVLTGETTTLFDMLKALKDPDVNRSITAIFGFLKGAGSK